MFGAHNQDGENVEDVAKNDEKEGHKGVDDFRDLLLLLALQTAAVAQSASVRDTCHPIAGQAGSVVLGITVGAFSVMSPLRQACYHGFFL